MNNLVCKGIGLVGANKNGWTVVTGPDSTHSQIDLTKMDIPIFTS